MISSKLEKTAVKTVALVTTDPGLFAKNSWHTDDQCRLSGPKKLTSRGCAACVMLGGDAEDDNSNLCGSTDCFWGGM